MIELFIEWFKKLDTTLQTLLISTLTTIFFGIFTRFYNILYERYSLTYKLKKEFEFSQRKMLKEEIAKNKIPLLNILEELNYRILTLNKNVGSGSLDIPWLNVSQANWFQNEQYFVNSFVYRYLIFLHFVLKTENDTISIDSTIADKSDISYLTYIKTFKNLFTEVDILKDLNYFPTRDDHHFFKNDLETYASWVLLNGVVMSFEEFKERLRTNYTQYKKVIEYFTTIKNDDQDMNLNVLRGFHLIIIKFLNSYGHNYQKTEKEKLKKLCIKYKVNLKIKKGYIEFLEKNKLEKEMCDVIKLLK